MIMLTNYVIGISLNDNISYKRSEEKTTIVCCKVAPSILAFEPFESINVISVDREHMLIKHLLVGLNGDIHVFGGQAVQ